MRQLKYIILSILNIKDRYTIALTLLLMFLVALIEVLNIALIGPYIGLLLSADYERLGNIIDYINGYTLLWGLKLDTKLLGLCLLFTLIISGILSYFANWKLSKVGFTLGYRINASLLRSYNSLNWESSQKLDRDYLLTLFGFDSLRFSNQVLLPMMQMFSKIIFTTLIICTLLIVNTKVAIITFGIFALAYGFIIIFIRKRLVVNSYNVTRFNQHRLTQLDQTLLGRKILTIQQKTNLFEGEFSRASELHALALGDNTALSVTPRYIVETLLFLLIITFITISTSHEQDAINLVTLTVFGIAGLKIMPIAQQVYAAIVSIKSNFSTANDLVSLHKFVCNEYTGVDRLTIQKKQKFSSIRLEDCTIRNEKKHNILSNICLEITAGEAVGIIGKSGSGKSTLMNCLAGLITPYQGEISLNGQTTKDKLYDKVNVSYVDSVPFIFKRDIYDNVALANNLSDKHTKQKIDGILIELGLHDLKSPEPQNAILSEDRVSSGQAQRIGIARAMLHESTDIYFLDEITSALDGTSEKIVMDYFYNQITRGKTCIIIAHRLETLKKCTRILVVDNGLIVEEGSYDVLAETSDLFQSIRNQS